MSQIPSILLKRSKKLRHNQSDAEQFLWHKLRSRRFVGFKFRRQHVLGNYIVDFYCLKEKLVIELDGGQHNFSNNIAYDENRTIYLQSLGIRVLRFWNNDVFCNTEAVLQVIYRSLD